MSVRGRNADLALDARRLPKILTTGTFAPSDTFRNKKAPDDAGALSLLEIDENSVAGDDRGLTEFVVKA